MNFVILKIDLISDGRFRKAEIIIRKKVVDENMKKGINIHYTIECLVVSKKECPRCK